MFKKKLSVKNDFIVTFFNGLATVCGIFLVTGIIARNFGLDQLGEFLLIRRIITASVGIILIGSNISLPSIFPRNQDSSFIFISIVLFFLFSFPLIIILSYQLNYYINNSSSFLSYFVYLFGFTLMTLCYSLYRSQMKILGANALQFLSLTLFSLIFVFLSDSIENLFFLTGISMIIFGLIFFYYGLPSFKKFRINKEKILKFLNFGFVRTPGIFFQFLLLAGIPLISISYLNLTDQAFLNAGISLVRIFLVVVGPLGVILLPRISKDFKLNKNNFKHTENISILLNITFYYSLISTYVLILINNQLLNLWLGSFTNQTNLNIAIILSSAPFFILSAVLRSPIDALSNYGYNSIIYGISSTTMILCFFILTSFKIEPFLIGSLSFWLGNFLSGMLSFYYIKKLINVNFLNLKSIYQLVFILVFLFFLIELIKFYLDDILTIIVSILSLSIVLIFHFLYSKLNWIYLARALILKK